MYARCCISLLLILWATVAVYGSRTNFQIKKFQMCNKTQGSMKFSGNVTTEGRDQYCTLDLLTPVPWDDDIGGTCRIESKTIGNTYTEIFVIREKNFCKAVHKYMGEFWYDIERAAQLTPGQCPIPAVKRLLIKAMGRHRVHHLKLDFSKIALQTFPFGALRFTIKLMDNRNLQANMLCWLIEVDNVLN